MNPYTQVQYADERRGDELWITAGDYYCAAACGYLSGFRAISEVDSEKQELRGYRSPKELGSWARSLVRAIVCYRIGDQPGRGMGLGENGCRIAEDLLEHETDFEGSWARPHVGLCHEVMGDLRLAGDLGGSRESYAEARAVYGDVENHLGWQAEPEFELLILTMLEFGGSVGYTIDEDTKDTIKNESLVARIEYKQAHYGDIIDRVLEAGGW